jgi:hypothetical protein
MYHETECYPASAGVRKRPELLSSGKPGTVELIYIMRGLDMTNCETILLDAMMVIPDAPSRPVTAQAILAEVLANACHSDLCTALTDGKASDRAVAICTPDVKIGCKAGALAFNHDVCTSRGRRGLARNIRHAD